MDNVNIYFDGGTYDQRICVNDNTINKFIIKHIENGQTNNELEYWALIIAIRYANRTYNSNHKVTFTGDSKLIINQVWGTWRINKKSLWILHNIVKKELEKATYTFIGRWTSRNRNFAGVHLEKLMKSEKK